MLISRHIDFNPPLTASSWRKIAIGTWRTCGDPSVYGILELDVNPAIAYLDKIEAKTGVKVTLTHFIGKALAHTIATHPEINCIQRFGRLYPRKSVDIFFQVASDNAGKDLTGVTLRNADKKRIEEIAQELRDKAQRIREKGDADFRKMKSTIGLLPGFVTGLLIQFTGFFMYGLNLWSPIFGSPKDPFGSAMITSIGSLGLDMAFAPLVPYSRIPLLIAFGAAKEVPVVRDGKIEIIKMARLCATFDHRIIDGVHASKMTKTLQRIFNSPETELD